MKPSLYSPTRYLNLLAEVLDDEGVDSTPVLRSFGMDRALLAHPETQMPPLQALMLFRALHDLVGGTDIGLRVGKRVTFGAFGDAGRALLSCATLRETLHCWAEFCTLISPSVALQVQEHPQHLALRWVPVRPIPFDFLRIAYDMAVGAFDALLHTVLGPRMQGYDVFFTYMAPPHAPLYARLTHARCHFDVPGLPCLRLHLDKDLLDTPMPLANAGELAVLRERLSRRVGLVPLDGLWTSWVTLMLEQAHGEQPRLETLAEIIRVSPSTLARHLTAEGRNFRTLSNEIRHRRACQWLREGQLMVSEIAQRLGYADLPSFVRAFKAASGVSPTRYAAAAGATALAAASSAPSPSP